MNLEKAELLELELISLKMSNNRKEWTALCEKRSELQKQIEARLGISLDGCSINPKTGEVIPTEQASEGKS